MGKKATFVVVGGGIAAVSCIEQLADLCPEEKIVILTASNVVKAISNWRKVGRVMESFEVEEKEAGNVLSQYSNVEMICEFVTELDSANKKLRTRNGMTVQFEKLCVATGGKPKVFCEDNEYVLGIRDTETVAMFQKKLKGARRILVVGNGGIATELVYEVQNVEVVWAIKHKSIAATFVDAGAGEFFLPHLSAEKSEEWVSKRLKYTAASPASSSCSVRADSHERGSALGPDWANELDLVGAKQTRKVFVEFECEVEQVLTPEEKEKRNLKVERLPIDFDSDENWPVFVKLNNSHVYGCDLIISATGVEPNVGLWLKGSNPFELGEDGGLKVDDQMETSIRDIFAVGDVCSASWEWAAHWVQMRLWTQAKQMGAYGGICMAQSWKGERATLDIAFEIFTHVTQFFGYKVVLLGRFNGQRLRPDHEALVRVTKGMEYVKVLIQDGCVQGAVLIGETDLEETIENLILNQTDISQIKDGFLDPSIDIEDYFD